jgi:hypothetical protein
LLGTAPKDVDRPSIDNFFGDPMTTSDGGTLECDGGDCANVGNPAYGEFDEPSLFNLLNDFNPMLE